MIKLSVFIFGQATGYKIYTVSREQIRLATRNSISSVWYLIMSYILYNHTKANNMSDQVVEYPLLILKDKGHTIENTVRTVFIKSIFLSVRLICVPTYLCTQNEVKQLPVKCHILIIDLELEVDCVPHCVLCFTIFKIIKLFHVRNE